MSVCSVLVTCQKTSCLGRSSSKICFLASLLGHLTSETKGSSQNWCTSELTRFYLPGSSSFQPALTVRLCPAQDAADSPGKSPQNANSHSAPPLSTGGSELSEAIGPPCLSSEFISALPPVLSLYPSIPSLPIKVSSCLLNSLYHLLL